MIKVIKHKVISELVATFTRRKTITRSLLGLMLMTGVSSAVSVTVTHGFGGAVVGNPEGYRLNRNQPILDQLRPQIPHLAFSQLVFGTDFLDPDTDLDGLHIIGPANLNMVVSPVTAFISKVPKFRGFIVSYQATDQEVLTMIENTLDSEQCREMPKMQELLEVFTLGPNDNFHSKLAAWITDLAGTNADLFGRMLNRLTSTTESEFARVFSEPRLIMNQRTYYVGLLFKAICTEFKVVDNA